MQAVFAGRIQKRMRLSPPCRIFLRERDRLISRGGFVQPNLLAFSAGLGIQPRKKADAVVATCPEQRQKIRLELWVF